MDANLILTIIGIPLALAAFIAIAVNLPSWIRQGPEGELGTSSLIVSGSPLPDPTRVSDALSPESARLRIGGAGGTWTGDPSFPGVSQDLRNHIQQRVDLARQVSGLEFAVFIGHIAGRDTAEVMHAGLRDSRSAVLLAVDPAAGRAEIVTGQDARVHLDDRSAAHAVLALRSGIDVGALETGIRDSLTLLGEHARAPRVLHLHEPA
jgi:hypothetical protein